MPDLQDSNVDHCSAEGQPARPVRGPHLDQLSHQGCSQLSLLLLRIQGVSRRNEEDLVFTVPVCKQGKIMLAK